MIIYNLYRKKLKDITDEEPKQTFFNIIVSDFLRLNGYENYNQDDIDGWYEVLDLFDDELFDSYSEHLVHLYRNLCDDNNFNYLLEKIKDHQTSIDINDFIDDDNENDLENDDYIEKLHYVWNASLKDKAPSTDILKYILSSDRENNPDSEKFKKEFIKSIGLEDDGHDDGKSYAIIYGDRTDLNDLYDIDDVFSEDVDERFMDYDSGNYSWSDVYSDLDVYSLIDIYSVLKEAGFEFSVPISKLIEWENQIKSIKSVNYSDFEDSNDYYKAIKKITKERNDLQREIKYSAEFRPLNSEIDDVLKEDVDNEDAYDNIEIDEIQKFMSWAGARAQEQADSSEFYNKSINALSGVFIDWEDGDTIKHFDKKVTNSEGEEETKYFIKLRIDPFVLMEEFNLNYFVGNMGEEFLAESIVSYYIDEEPGKKLSFDTDHIYGSVEDEDLSEIFREYLAEGLDVKDLADLIKENSVFKFKDF